MLGSVDRMLRNVAFWRKPGEIMALADRIAVMYKGEIVAVVPRAEATREGLGLLMAGVRQEEIKSSLQTRVPV